jgi:hypothetical protein
MKISINKSTIILKNILHSTSIVLILLIKNFFKNYTKTLYTNMKNRGYKLSNGMRCIFSNTSTGLAAPAL